MKKKINITMQVTYEVTKECEVDSEVLESLKYIQDYHPRFINAYVADMDTDAREGYDWMVDNCDEHKCVSWDVEIQDLDEEE